MGELAAEGAQALVAEFEADYHGTEEEPPRFAVVALTEEVIDSAARQCATHGLQAYDAGQLVAAMAARVADPACSALAVFDLDLRAAADIEGFALVPAAICG